jgi:energy-coupling factor transporter ATP-binding protein EcfA2
MIDRVHFEKFKSLENVTLELGRLTALVGPNGCGKSSVLQGIHLLSQIGGPQPTESIERHRLAAIFDGACAPGRLATGGPPATLRLAMRRSEGEELALAISVPAETDDGMGSKAPEFDLSLAGGPHDLTAHLPQRDAVETYKVIRPFYGSPVRPFASVVYLHLDANEMRRTSIPRDETPRMAADGAGLASALASMKGAAEDDFAQLTRDLTRVVPGVKRIRTLRERVSQRRMDKVEIDGQPIWRPVDEEALGDRFEIDFDNGPSVPADLLSEGTVLALGLLTKLREPRRPKLVLLDDIDRGLHIEAQARLVQVLRDLLAAEPELQIVCTTHSPYLLSRFDAPEIRVLALDEERHTHARKLTEHPEFEKWQFGTQTGELWAALGEAWVTAPRRENSG